MEVPDTTVRVLYDFEYKTKDGREIKIKCSERLFLIKKTNHDWWQVIRSFERRPFYVPASYVEEIQRNKTGSDSSDGNTYKFKKNIAITDLDSETDSFVQHQSLQHLQSASGDSSLHSDKAYRNRSFSLEDKRVSIYSNKEKTNSTNKTHFSTLSSSGYESLSEIGLPGVLEQNTIPSQIDIDYVNLRKEGDGFVIEEVETHSSMPSECECEAAVSPGEPVITDKESLLSNTDNSFQGTISNKLNKIEIDNNESGNYSNVSCISDSVQNSVSIGNDLISKLPLSTSLEELAQQIELKTNKLRKCPDFTKIFHSLENDPVSGSDENSEVSKAMLDSSKNESVVDVASKVKNLNKSEDSSLSFVGLTKKLQYAGSFKTKLERQKWAKQHFEHSSLKHVVEDEQIKSVSKVNIEQEDCAKNITSIDINYTDQVASIDINEFPSKIDESIQKEAKYSSHIKKEKLCKDDMALKQKTGSRQSLDSIVEDEDSSNISSNNETNQHSEDKVKWKTIIEPTPSVSINIRPPDFIQSDKGSTESLLDIDKHFNSRKISGGTTSDGEDLDLDNSDSETDSIILGMTRLKNSADDIRKNQKRRISLTRNRRVSLRHESQWVHAIRLLGHL